MYEFLTSGTFWTASSTIITFIGVLIALFLPFYTKKKEYTNMKELIKLELKNNILIFRDLEDFNKSKNLGEVTINSTDLNIAKLKILKLNIWNEYKYKASIHNNNIYKDFHDINTQIATIIALLSTEKIDRFTLQYSCMCIKKSIEEKKFNMG